MCDQQKVSEKSEARECQHYFLETFSPSVNTETNEPRREKSPDFCCTQKGVLICLFLTFQPNGN